MTGRAYRQGSIGLRLWNPRTYSADPHRTVDDRPYGGGPGMVMKFEPTAAAIRAARTAAGGNAPVLYLSPQGKPFDQQAAARLAHGAALVLLCGRYEGLDERIVEVEVDEEWSIGDYVLSGGELAAMVLIDAVTRLVPGVLGHEDSARQDSYVGGLLDYPHYTRPEVVAGHGVPAALLCGDHAAIRRWRLKQSLGRTWLRRPDLLETVALSAEEQRLLDEFLRECDLD